MFYKQNSKDHVNISHNKFRTFQNFNIHCLLKTLFIIIIIIIFNKYSFGYMDNIVVCLSVCSSW